MSNIKCRDTKPEIALRRALRDAGLTGYRKNFKGIPGTPDVAFTKHKVAIFADGGFWHGRDWESRRPKMKSGSNPGYWIPKIEANIARDRRVDAELEAAGWTVVRFWDNNILKNPAACAEIAIKAISGHAGHKA